jgi:hypothetical protein
MLAAWASWFRFCPEKEADPPVATASPHVTTRMPVVTRRCACLPDRGSELNTPLGRESAGDIPVGSDTLPLVKAHRRLRLEYGLKIGYAALWKRIVAGVVPADQIGHRWHVRVEDIPAAAKALGLTRVAPERG